MAEAMSIEELYDLPSIVGLRVAAKAFGIGATHAYRLAQADRFPCAVIRVGNQYRVTREAIFEARKIRDPRAPQGVS